MAFSRNLASCRSFLGIGTGRRECTRIDPAGGIGQRGLGLARRRTTRRRRLPLLSLRDRWRGRFGLGGADLDAAVRASVEAPQIGVAAAVGATEHTDADAGGQKRDPRKGKCPDTIPLREQGSADDQEYPPYAVAWDDLERRTYVALVAVGRGGIQGTVRAVDHRQNRAPDRNGIPR